MEGLKAVTDKPGLRTRSYKILTDLEETERDAKRIAKAFDMFAATIIIIKI